MARYALIEGGRLLDIGRRTLARAELLIEDDRIAAILPPGETGPGDALRIDASERLLMPGLVNAHTHGHSHLGKGSGDAWTLDLLLHHGPWLSGGRAAEDRELACWLGGLEMIRRGVTACYDLLFDPPAPNAESLEAAARGYARAGIRVVLAPMVADRSFYQAIPGLMEAFPEPHRQAVEAYQAAPQATTMAALRDIAAHWRGDRDRARLALAPTIPLHCSDELMLGCRDLAREFGLGLHMHVAEARFQAVSGPIRYDSSLVAHLAELGLLGPGFTAAHAVWIDADDIARLADAGAAVAHNPGSNLRLGAGIAPARDMLDRGVTVGIGTDGSTCSDHQNVFEAMRLASLVSRIRSPDPDRWITAQRALELATEGGAAVLGFAGTLGRLEPGYLADIVFLDLGDLSYIPLNDPVTQIVMAESGAAVDSVMIGGEFVYRDRRFPGLDLARLRDRIEARAAELRPRLAPTREALTALERYVTAFCIGLAREA